MENTNQRIILTKRLLKEGLVRLLETKELDKISVSELCKEAGINRATFYRHYETPKQVLLELEMDFISKMEQNISYPSSKKEVKKSMEEFCTYLYEHSSTVKLLLRSNSTMDFIQLLSKLSEEMLKHNMLHPELNSLDPDSLKLLTTYFGGGGYFLLRCWLLEDIRKPPKEIAALITNALLLGENFN